jgi:hypothetical protein
MLQLLFISLLEWLREGMECVDWLALGHSNGFGYEDWNIANR